MVENILSFDVEEWHHRTAFQKLVEKQNINTLGSALEGVKVILNLLDKYEHKATFFVLGEVAVGYPEIPQMIHERGHEIGYHGYSHKELDKITFQEFEVDLKNTVREIDRIVGVKPVGYRAPRFSLNKNTCWVLDTLNRHKFKYDSSIFPANIYYGSTGVSPTRPYRVSMNDPSKEDPSSPLIELPLLVRELPFNIRVPVKLRHTGVWFTQESIKAMNKRGYPATLVFHSWEFIKTPEKVKELIPWKLKITRNINIPCGRQLEPLLKEFKFTSALDFIEGNKQPRIA